MTTTSIPYFCPICGDILFKVQNTASDGTVWCEWQCPEGDWFEPTECDVAPVE